MKLSLSLLLATLLFWHVEVSARDTAPRTSSTRRRAAAPPPPPAVDGAAFQCALNRAKQYYNANQAGKKLKSDPPVVALVDLDAASNSQRMTIVNVQTGQVIRRHTVARGSGGINTKAGSHGSELGFMRVSEPYVGKHGNSVRIDGLERDNADARARAIVIHGASYVTEGGHAGRSWGCFAVDRRSVASVINTLKGGSLLYSYRGSKVCNSK